ncbi:MAG: hypothetical protein NTV19_06545 [Burkholderiales bacterium]|nr:hypothetical protein [Burkholderiales bacterium]
MWKGSGSSDIDAARADAIGAAGPKAARGAGAAKGSRQAHGVTTRLERVLAAERLLALQGLMGVSLREIVAATSQRRGAAQSSRRSTRASRSII